MKKLTCRLAFLLLLLSSNHLLAGEVDQFTKRFEPLNDSSVIMNKLANDYLKQSIDEANKITNTCDEKVLYKKMRNYFANHKDGEITIFALHDSSVEKIKLKISESIFKDWSIWNGRLLGRKSADQSDIALSPLVRIGTQVIGTDKFEHLFGRGFKYFTDYYLGKRTLEKTLKSGILGEKTIYGGNFLATGVFSYADLSANFNGMRFWNHVLQRRVDILGRGSNLGPYVLCENKKFILNKNTKIDFTNYFDPSYDEGINCSKFSNKDALNKFNKSLKNLSQKSSVEYRCPMDDKLLNKMIEKYGEFSQYIINSKGNNTVSYFAEFENL